MIDPKSDWPEVFTASFSLPRGHAKAHRLADLTHHKSQGAESLLANFVALYQATHSPNMAYTNQQEALMRTEAHTSVNDEHAIITHSIKEYLR